MVEQIRARDTRDQHGNRGLRQVRSFLYKLAMVAASLLLWQGEAHATHAMGGELSYTCLGNNRYLVTLNFYRDCNGVAAPTNCNNGLRFNVASSACGGLTQLIRPVVQVIIRSALSGPVRGASGTPAWSVIP